MKKSILFLLLAVFTNTVFGSRQTDIELRLVSPQNNTNIPTGNTVDVVLQAKNAGGDDFQITDTIRVRLILNGIAVPFYNPVTGVTDTFLHFHSFKLAPGDSAVIFTQQFALNDSGNNTHTLCFESSLRGAATSIDDPNSANNKSCARIFFGTAGIAAVNRKESQFDIFPLPAGNTLNWKTTDNFQPSSIAFYNLIGACVQRTEVVAGNTALDISQLPAGLYILRATATNGQVLNRRFLKE